MVCANQQRLTSWQQAAPKTNISVFGWGVAQATSPYFLTIQAGALGTPLLHRIEAPDFLRPSTYR